MHARRLPGRPRRPLPPRRPKRLLGLPPHPHPQPPLRPHPLPPPPRPLPHTLPFGLILCLLLAALSPHRLLSFTTYLALFHLHLLLDSYGSGPGWGIAYFWPFSRRAWVNPAAWEFFSWENLTTAAALIAWTIAIAVRQRRTPLEALMPNLDRQLVETLRRFSRPPAAPSAT